MKKYLGLVLTLGALSAALGAPWLAASDPMTTDFARGARRGAVGHAARLRAGRGRARRRAAAPALPPRVAERRAVDHRRGEPAVLAVRGRRGGHLLPGLRCAAADAGVGQHAEREPRLPLCGVVAGSVSRGGAGADGARREPVG